jgi:Mlc titration factor MtfA (ptsG expression regulator)
MFDFWKRRQHAAIVAEPFPEAWLEVLERDVAYVAKLTPEERKTLEGLVQIFIAEKSFEGCGGLAMTDEIKVTIAAHACLLVLHLDVADVYPGLDSILVYPSAYRATSTKREGRVVIESDDARLGESWTRGVVVLAWDHVLRSARHLGGDNVVLHEFAHQLDAADGSVDGAPDLGSRARYASWARVLGEEFADLSDKLHRGRASDIDAYGATSPPEFFAVVSEMFFEKPGALKSRHPELYAELAAFYKQDPASA